MMHALSRWGSRYGTLVATAALGCGALGVLSVFDPAQPDSGLPSCPFFSLTGLYCPGCGATRALHALAHGDLFLALAMNPLLVVSLPLLLVLVLHGARFWPGRLARIASVIAQPLPWLFVLLGYGVARNLPIYPFVLLAPG